MRRIYRSALLGGVALLVACGGGNGAAESADSATMGMSAEEHARMLAGMPGADAAGAPARREPVRLTAAQARAIGLTYAVAERRPLVRAVRTVGQFVPAEPGLTVVSARVEGFVERLYVDATGVPVRRGQPLLTLYSPMVVAAEEELLAARRLAAAVDSADGEAARSAAALVAAARRRLSYWEVPADHIERVERTGEVSKTVTITVPADGYVQERMVAAGQAVMAGMPLYRLADLSVIWIEGEVFERDLALVRVGTPVLAEVAAQPGRAFRGRVSFVWPFVNPETRTARVRVELRNPGGALKPGMVATLFFEGGVDGDALSVPSDAVVMTGERNVVFVVAADATLVPRDVTVGARAGDRLQILAGLAEGERVVASANFLVDAESRLGGTTGMPGMPGMPATGDTAGRRP